ncbi:MAG: hypothetical protein GX080_04100 [Tissierellia bacterium]|nr:hypothetical protein [Tissierellia bacterium]
MYLFIGFFKEDEIDRKRKYISEKNVEPIKKVFPAFLDLNHAHIKATIGYFLGKGNGQKPCFLMDIDNISASEKNIIIDFNKVQELDKTSEEIRKEIYKKSWQFDWIDKETGFCPLLLMVDKQTFDSIRKGTANIRKLSDKGEKVRDLKAKNKWDEICKLYEPLEDIHKNSDIWDNPDELYEIGFACSKMGEPQNGLEKDREHLKTIKRYRDLSLRFYKRCFELEPTSYRYASSVAYRYYQNINELTKPKGRRDGNVSEEIENAHEWFDKSLSLYPTSIKDNYRKGKMILDKQLPNMKYSGRELLREDFQEMDNLEDKATNCLRKAIGSYESLSDDNRKKYYRNEYIKSLYTLGKFYIDQVKLPWNEFLCSRIGNKFYSPLFAETEYLVYGKELMEKCYKEVIGIDMNDELDLGLLTNISKKSTTSPVDILYSLGVLYFKMYFIKHVQNKQDNIQVYRSYAYKFLNGAIDLRKEFRKQRIPFRNTDYINNCLANLNIIDNNYREAIYNTKRSKTSYIKNTYAAALMLTNDMNNIREATRILKPIVSDKHNLSRNLSIVLLAKAYQLIGEEKEQERLINDSNKSVDRLLELIL